MRLGIGRGLEKLGAFFVWRVWGGFVKRCFELYFKVWVVFKYRKCEGSFLGRWNRRRRGLSRKEGV